MPSLFRFLVWIGIIAGVIYGGMYAMVTFVEPDLRQMSVRLPAGSLDPQPILPPPPAEAPAGTDAIGTGTVR